MKGWKKHMENIARKKDRSPPEKLRILKAHFKGFESLKTETQNKNTYKEKMTMITKNMIIEGLENRGYIVDAHTCIKNGIEKEGLCIKKSESDTIAPTVYADDLIERAYQSGMGVEQVIDSVVALISREFTFDVEKINDVEYFKTNARIGVQRESSEDLVKRPTQFEGIEEYIYLADEHEGESFSIKVRPQMLDMWRIDTETAFARAEENTHKDTEITPLGDVLRHMMGDDFADEFGESESSVAPMYVISNKSQVKGASAMLDTKAIKELADRIGVHEFVLIPSSIHECILVPKFEDISLDFFNNMVTEVNETTVDPLDKLVDRAYLLTA